MSVDILVQPQSAGGSTFVDTSVAQTAIAAPTTLTSSALTKWHKASTYSIAGVTSASADTVTYASHGLLDGDAVVPQSTAAGLTSGVIYFVRDRAASTFKLAATPGGAAVDLDADATITFKCSYRITLPSASGIYGAIIIEFASDFANLGEIYDGSTTITKCWANDVLLLTTNGTAWKKTWLYDAPYEQVAASTPSSILFGPLDVNTHSGYILTGRAKLTDILQWNMNQDATVNNYKRNASWATQDNSITFMDSNDITVPYNINAFIPPVIGSHAYFTIVNPTFADTSGNYLNYAVTYKATPANLYALTFIAKSGTFADGSVLTLRRCCA